MRVRGVAALATAAILVSSTAWAALPPMYQRLEEMKAVIAAIGTSPELDAIGEIITIEYVDVDRYEVRGELCTSVARIVSGPDKGSAIVGPRIFSVEIDEATCG